MEIKYIAYPKAMILLADRLEATQEELAAWVWMGPQDGGLAAYLNANELDPPPRFYYINNGNDCDYLSPLMACWFLADDITQFEPADRYITGKTLIERWNGQPNIQAEPFICDKIAESRLLDLHPFYGGTQGGFPKNVTYPPLESGLFVLSHVEKIEAEDFVIVKTTNTIEKEAYPEIGSAEWRQQNATQAANALHNKQGGSRDKQREIREKWATGNFSSRDICAEQECASLGMSFSSARKALRNTPDP